MKKLLTVSVLTFVFAVFGAVISVKPTQALTVPSLNPTCWIMDSSNAFYKQNCKGHNLSWPHWGGGSSSDGPNRGCGGGTIYAQALTLTPQDLRAFSYPGGIATYGTVQSQLVLTKAVHYVVRFSPDYMVYTWQAQNIYRVTFNGGGYGTAFTKSYATYGSTTNVKCDMNGHYKS